MYKRYCWNSRRLRASPPNSPVFSGLDDGLSLRQLALERGVLLLEFGELFSLFSAFELVLREVLPATRPELDHLFIA